MKSQTLVFIGILFAGIVLFKILDQKFNFQKKIYSATNAVEGDYKTISLAEVKNMLDEKKAILLDVRNPQELKSDGYISGALNIPLGELESKISQLDKKNVYITFCAVGGRSQKAAAILAEKGFKKIFNAEDGMKNWPYDKII